MITLSWLLLIALAGGVLAIVDGIWRLRARGGSTIIGIIEIIVAGLFVLSLFLTGIPFGSLVLGIATLVVLIVALVTRGRLGMTLTLIALALIAIWLVLENRWIVIPGLN
ncbi:hypothetical protein [Agromyces sp. SYSU T0242]|uniref:hypothetical protein n=1 Tax=Agromyces litoreus TaxID=3158561 RepID=UPI003394B943